MLARRRDRIVLVAAILFAIVFPVLFWAWVDRLTGFGLAGREVLPILVMIPMAAGEAKHRGHHRLLGTRSGHEDGAAAIVAIAVFQGYAWWINARVMAGAPDDAAGSTTTRHGARRSGGSPGSRPR